MTSRGNTGKIRMKNLRGGGKGAIIYYVPWGWGFPENFGLSKLYSPPAPHATKKSHENCTPQFRNKNFENASRPTLLVQVLRWFVFLFFLHLGIDFISDKIPLVRGVVWDFEGVRTGNLVPRVFSNLPYGARETKGRRENLGKRL